jgi:invasion protein IalB
MFPRPSESYSAKMAILRAVRYFPCFCFFATVLFSSLSQAFEERIKGRFGAWQLHCGTSSPLAKEHCVIVQTVFSEENPSVFVGIIISRRPPANAILQVIAPLNVLLSKGVNLKIGQDDPLQFDFIRCVPQGCQAETMIDDKLLKQFESGKIGDVVIYESRSRGLRHLAPLDGFKEAYSNLH